MFIKYFFFLLLLDPQGSLHQDNEVRGLDQIQFFESSFAFFLDDPYPIMCPPLV